ncbi:unnamed protein product, partial [Allacma fusca]
MRWAEKIWLRKVQQDSYPEEVQMLQNGLLFDKNNRFGKLDVFLGDDGVLRMRGRTIEAPLQVVDAANPVVLD